MSDERVADIFAGRKPTRVVRHDLPKLAAFNFMLDGVPEGRVNASLGLDGRGKSVSFLLLDMPLQVEAQLLSSDTKSFPVELLG